MHTLRVMFLRSLDGARDANSPFLCSQGTFIKRSFSNNGCQKFMYNMYYCKIFSNI